MNCEGFVSVVVKNVCRTSVAVVLKLFSSCHI